MEERNEGMFMKIALITENSQKKKNSFIFKVLEKVATKYHHEVLNYGVKEDEEDRMDYVGAGVLTGILLNTHAVDFVITGCASGEGVILSANAMPNVLCGYVADVIDANLFQRVNAGNAISIPFGKFFGTGAEIFLESIFETLFSSNVLSGYPEERRNIQINQKEKLDELKRISQISLLSILEEMDKDFLYPIIHNDFFEENFFRDSKDDEVADLLKQIIDVWE